MTDFAARLPDVPLTPIGSLRRWAPTLGDVDLLAATDDPDAALDAFAALPDVLRIVAREADRVRVQLIDGAEAECITRPTPHGGRRAPLADRRQDNRRSAPASARRWPHMPLRAASRSTAPGCDVVTH